MKVALSHDWLNGMRGGEKCLEVLCELYPDSPIYTLFYEEGKVSCTIQNHPIVRSRLQAFPGIASYYRYYLPLFPGAVESFHLEGYDLVVSTSHCVAKGVRKDKKALHVCYCFTPMRYAWGFFDEYFGKKNHFMRQMIHFFIERLKTWDLQANGRVDHFIAISEHVRKRIQFFYQREADVIYPPVDTDYYTPDPKVARENFYLIVSALVPYKKIEMAVEVFNALGYRLVIIGDGPETKSLKLAAKHNVEFLGWQPDSMVRDYYRRAKALIFPGEEDFGIVPLEMQACGGFVIAYGKGGALETIKDRETGLFFHEPSVESFKKTVIQFEKEKFSSEKSRANALRFSRQRHKDEMRDKLNQLFLERASVSQ